MKEIKTYYRNRLPHVVPIGATFFVTFRLDDSLPYHIVKQLRTELKLGIQQLLNDKPLGYQLGLIRLRKRNFNLYDKYLDGNKWGECYLKQAEVAQIIKDKLFEYDGSNYILNNPVKAEMVENWSDFPHSFVNFKFVES